MVKITNININVSSRNTFPSQLSLKLEMNNNCPAPTSSNNVSTYMHAPTTDKGQHKEPEKLGYFKPLFPNKI